MKIKEAMVDRSITINLGNYESLKLNVSLTAEVHDGDSPERVLSDLTEKIEAELARQAEEYFKNNK